MIVLDTCALYWWTVEPQALTPKAAVACRKIADTGALVCAVSLWELGLKARAGQLDLGCPIRDYAARLEQVVGLEVVPVDVPLWLDSLELDWSHRDPADRLMVALAKRRHLSLVTADKTIREWYPQTIW
ncbi:MAG: type II toxin-antitoxin system VapC family toxin [Lentisphaeria bacterium]